MPHAPKRRAGEPAGPVGHVRQGKGPASAWPYHFRFAGSSGTPRATQRRSRRSRWADPGTDALRRGGRRWRARAAVGGRLTFGTCSVLKNAWWTPGGPCSFETTERDLAMGREQREY